MPDKRRPGQKSYELRQPEGMRYAGRPADSDLAESLLKMIAVGVAGGIALIAGAKKLGEELQDIQEDIASKYKEQREAYKQAVRAAVANEIETEYETGSDSDDPTDDLI